MLRTQTSRRIYDRYKIDNYNAQALKIRWLKIEDDRRRKEWIVYEQKPNQQLGRITKKRDEEVLAEHWLMEKEEGKTSTKISRCKGCEHRSPQMADKCERWIRRDHNIRVIPEALIEKNRSKINATVEQLVENRSIEEWKKEENELVEIRQLENLEVELVRKQKLDKTLIDQLIEILKRNKERNKDKYVVYTDGALYKGDGKDSMGKLGIGWVQIGENNNWPEEEVALGLEGWPSATIAELVAIWAVMLTVPEGKQIEIYTDSSAAIRNISKALQDLSNERILKRKNAMWIKNIIGLTKSKNVKLKFFKVKSHSEDKWNDRADYLAKRGANCKKLIQADKINCDEIGFYLE
jgi:ribonuclease HI